MTTEPTDERAWLRQRVDHDLTLHPPVAEYIADGMDDVRQAAKDFAAVLLDKCATGRELSTALTKVEEALFFGIAAIARYQPDPEEA